MFVCVTIGCLAILASLAGPVMAQRPFGPWYGGYSINTGSKGLDLTLNLDQLKGGRAGLADLSIFALKSKLHCPRSAHPAFCDEMARRAAKSDWRSAFKINVVGVRYTKKRAVIAFRFADERASRLLILDRTASSASGYRARIIHYTRGLDMVGRASETKHICQQAMCGPDRLKDLIERPQVMLGVLADKGFGRAYPMKKDERKSAWARRSSRGSARDSGPSRQPDQTGAAASSLFGLTGLWHLQTQNGKALGKLRFNSQASGNVLGSGLLAAKWGGMQRDVAISLVRQGPSALDLSLGYAGQARGKPRLLLSLPNGSNDQLGGTLIQGRRWQLVRLSADRRSGATSGNGGQSMPPARPIAPPIKSDPADFTSEEPIEGDMPGSGVTGPAYRMRNVPQGRRLALRSAPDRSAASVGTIAWNASEILVLGCEPAINPVAFDRADLATKRRFLSRGWCEIDHEGKRGHVIGTYLDPIIDR